MEPPILAAALQYLNGNRPSGKPRPDKDSTAPSIGILSPVAPASLLAPECPICYRPFSQGCIPGLMTCGHGICYTCWTHLKVAHDGRRCPSCRSMTQHHFIPNRPLAEGLGFTIVIPRCPSNILLSILDRREHHMTNEISRVAAQFYKLLTRIDSLLEKHGATIAAHQVVEVADSLVAYPLHQLYQISNLVYQSTGVVVVFVEASKAKREEALNARRAEAVVHGKTFNPPKHKLYCIHIMYVDSVSSATVRLHARYLRESGISRPGTAFQEFHCAPPRDQSVVSVVVADIFRNQHNEHWYHATVRSESGDITLPRDREPSLRERVHRAIADRRAMLSHRDGRRRTHKRPRPGPSARSASASASAGAGAGAGAGTGTGTDTGTATSGRVALVPPPPPASSPAPSTSGTRPPAMRNKLASRSFVSRTFGR